MHPFFVSQSAHLFTSLKAWLTVTCWNLLRRYLQSFRSGEYAAMWFELESKSWTTILASNSTSKQLIPNCNAICSPSLKAQNSVIKLVAWPIFRANPLIHIPLWSLITPPPPVLPGLPKDAPLVFNLAYPSLGFFHLTWATL